MLKRDDKPLVRRRVRQRQRKSSDAREQETRRDLDQLVVFLTGAAADAASDERLTCKDRKFLLRQRDILIGSADELIKVLQDHPQAHIREHRIRALFDVLGSACIIARNQLVDPIKDRLSTIAATKGRSALTPKIDEIIASEANAVRQRHPDFSDNEISRQIKNRVNELIAEAAAIEGVKKIQLGQRAIGVRLKKMGF